MPIQTPYTLPASPQHLPLQQQAQPPSTSPSPSTPSSSHPNPNPSFLFLLLFLASTDPATNAPWCSDVRAALPVLDSIFGSDESATVRHVYVGQKEEWKKGDNVYRTVWGVDAVPCLVRYEVREGRVVEVGRMKEGELLDGERVREFSRG